MVKRRIPLLNRQVYETKLIETLNKNLSKDKPAQVNTVSDEDIQQEANDYYEDFGTVFAKNDASPVVDDKPDFNKVESDRQRCIKYDAHADNVGYANAGPSPVWNNTMVFKDLTPEAIEKIEKVIGPVAKSILERFDTNCFSTSLKDNEECRKTVNSEMQSDFFMDNDDTNISTKVTKSGKEIMERCKDVAEKLTGKDLRKPKKTVNDVLPVPTECTYVVDLAADENDKTVVYEMVDHPSHYNLYDIEAIEMIERIWGAENAALWCEITAFKYRMRMGTKPGEDVTRDLNKEQWYLKKAKELRNKIS